MSAKNISQTAIDNIASALGLESELARAALSVALENVVTLDRKQMDYGSANLTDFGVTGVVVRMNDKMSRIKNIVTKENAIGSTRGPVAIPNNEPLSDSFLDLSNYGLIAFVMSQGLWPVAKPYGHDKPSTTAVACQLPPPPPMVSLDTHGGLNDSPADHSHP